jgi:hypothetical protein
MLKVVHDEAEPSEASCSVLDEIVREAARQMLAVALQAEVSAYIDAHAEEVDENGHRVVVRNGHHNEREVITAAARCRCGRRGSTTSAPFGHWGAETVRFGDPARVGTQVAAGGRGAAAAVPARPVQLGFRSGVDAVPGHQPRPVGGDDHEVDQGLAGHGDDVQQFKNGKLIERLDGSEGGDQQVA